MGSRVSKLFFHSVESQKENTEIKAVTQQVVKDNNEICTPKRVLLDPRSVSEGIRRTPIEVKVTPSNINKKVPNAIPRYLLKKQYLETDMDLVIPPPSPKKHLPTKFIKNIQLPKTDVAQNHLTPDITAAKSSKAITPIDKERYKILGLDPRSPAADFDRTPILLPRSLALLKARSQEYLNRKGSYEENAYNPRNSYQDISMSCELTEIQSLPDMVSEGFKMLDLIKQKELDIIDATQSDSDSSVFASGDDTVIKNPKFKSKKDESLIIGVRLFDTDKDRDNTDKQDDHKNVIEEKTVHTKDDDKIKIWHDLLSSEENIPSKIEEKKNIEEKLPREKISRQDVIITFDTVNNIPLKTMKIEEDIWKKEDIGRKEKIFKTNTKFKSEEKKIFNSDNKNCNEIPKNRTPFSNRSNNDHIQKMSTKSPQQLLKNNAVNIKTQQENTPPCMKHIAKTKNEIQWDPNSTVVI